MRKFESLQKLADYIGIQKEDYYSFEFAVKDFIHSNVEEIRENKGIFPEIFERLDFNDFYYMIGYTRNYIKDGIKEFYWVENDKEAELYFKNKDLMGVLDEAISKLEDKMNNYDIVEKAINIYNKIMETGDYSKSSINKCIREIRIIECDEITKRNVDSILQKII